MNDNPKNIKIISIAILACLTLIVIISAIIASNKKIDFYNLDQIETGLSDQEISDLEQYVLEKLTTDQESEINSGVKVLIRPSSFEKRTKNPVTLYKFLIDIDEFESTYEVSFGLVGERGFYEPPTIACPLPNQMKYPGKNCVGQRSTTTAPTFEFKLPHYFRSASGEFVTITANYPNDGQDYLDVRVSSCGNPEIIDTARTEVEEWIESLGYDPKDYDIRIPEFCDGEAN